jgi:mono/diheme cytochrome c family protein
MTNRSKWTMVGGSAVVAVLAGLCARFATAESRSGSRAESRTESPEQTRAARGEYLVKSIGCNDCHTPLKPGPNGPEPDMTRMLSGHPEQLVMPPAPRLAPGPWMVSVSVTNTAWAGPWGVSFTANLTPDKETGLGAWNERTFIDAIRSGRHMGRGRPILPPMPAQAFANLTDEDLASIFAYLRTLAPLRNRVPDPIPAPSDSVVSR